MLLLAVTLTLATVLTTLSGCGAAGVLDSNQGKPRGVPPGESMSDGERALALQVLDLLNAERTAGGLSPLIWDETAADVAYDHCVDMRLRGYIGHYDPEGHEGCQRLWNAGVEMVSCGENIAHGHQSPAGVMTAWMASAGHRFSIMNPGFTRVGIGVHAGDGGPWWTQDFIAPVPAR